MAPELAKRIVSGLREAGIDFVTYLPESRLSQILPLLRKDKKFQLAPVASEADAVSIAAGATLAGKQSACYMEDTGVYVACYQLIVIAMYMRVPMLLAVTHLGGFEDQRNSFHYAVAGATLIPQLEALGIQYKVVENGAGLETKIKDAVRTMNSLRLPVALIFTGEFTL